ncbi:hypothetical protein AAG570_011491 [Ranatra chinensis]|uniref:N-terminal methionine N(alpha)-acetyltransferase NatC n=1 Tax=Ranatra chinensis TaxID=642074 RepID=A0ABD0YKU4_9HEMI
METTKGKSVDSHDLKVDLTSKNCIKDAGKIKHSLEDTNRNLTILPSKGKLVHEGSELSSVCENKTPSLVLHGPNGLVNGVDVEKHNLHHTDCSAINKSNLDDSSSHCEACVKNSESRCESSVVSSEQSPQENATGSSLVDQSDSKSFDPDYGINYVSYESELQMPDIMRLIQKDLSEPYSIYTYRYFIHNWPKLCFLAMDEETCVGAIVCKLDIHRKVIKRGYIAMLAVDEKHRKRKIGTNLVLKAIRAMVADDADEIVLETEITNKPALRLYENLGFVRDKRLFRYYLNGVDALRLKLWLR